MLPLKGLAVENRTTKDTTPGKIIYLNIRSGYVRNWNPATVPGVAAGKTAILLNLWRNK